MAESDLFNPIKEYFVALGYAVDGEVGRIDMVCEKDGQYIGVELKKTFDFRVLMQSAQRQKTMDLVFVGTWRPKSMKDRVFKDKLYLLSRLGLGLIVVSQRTMEAEVVLAPVEHPLDVYKKANQKQRLKLIYEFEGRRSLSNIGGVHGKKLMTRYRENSLLVAYSLSQKEGQMAKGCDIARDTGISSATNIMYRNVYGWFSRVDTGVYSLNELGVKALAEYADTVEKMRS